MNTTPWDHLCPKSKGTVYLIHFDEPIAHAQHYMGYCYDGNLERRIKDHKANRGSKLLKAANERGIGWSIVRIWNNVDGNYERKLKNQKNSRSLCPRCKEMHLKLKREQKFRRQTRLMYPVI